MHARCAIADALCTPPKLSKDASSRFKTPRGHLRCRPSFTPTPYASLTPRGLSQIARRGLFITRRQQCAPLSWTQHPD
eukprot:1074217-Pyramimonas_sp.AAC.1